MKNILLVSLCVVFAAASVYAQESHPATGGSASGVGGSASYSIGQLFYQVVSGTDAYVTEGVQQPYEISVITSNLEPSDQEPLVNVYPNPVRDVLVVEVHAPDQQGLAIQLFDLSGKLLKEENLLESHTSVPMEDFDPGVYILRVTGQNNVMQTFRILKNH